MSQTFPAPQAPPDTRTPRREEKLRRFHDCHSQTASALDAGSGLRGEFAIMNPPGKDLGSGSVPGSNDQYFRTDHLLTDLRGRTISSGLVTVSAQGGKFLLSLGSAVVLARLLNPHDFGLVAMVTTVLAFLAMFKEAGLSTATVQKETITHAQVSNLFWINVALGALMCLGAAALAPALAWFYREPVLVDLTLVLSVTFLLTGLTVQHQALLNRQMRFRAIAVIEIVSMVVSVAVGVVMAWLEWGYWSLAGMQISVATMALVMTWRASGWRPSFPVRRSGTVPLLRFGADLTAADFVYRIARGTDTILLGRFWGTEAVGLYSRATALLMRPLEQLLSPVSSVLVPVLSRLQGQPERYRRIFLQAFDALALVSFPATAICLALSRPLILVLLGPAWEGAAVLFAGLTLAALYLPLAIAATWLFTSQGRGRDMLRTNLILSMITLIAFAAGIKFGALGLVLAFSASGFLFRLPTLYYMAGRAGPVRTADLWRGFFRHLPIWGAVYLATSVARGGVGKFTPLVQLLICFPIGMVAGAAVIGGMKQQRENAREIFQAIKSTILARNRPVSAH